MFRCRRYKLIIFGAVVMCVLCYGGYLWLLYRGNKCSDEDSIKYLDSLCRNYSSGLITGSLCKPLCDTREITLQRCLGHGVKLHVLEAKWGEDVMVLKTPKPLGTETAIRMTNELIPKGTGREMSLEEFVKHAVRHLLFNQIKGQSHVDNRTLAIICNIITECDVGHDGSLSYIEVITCWQLVDTTEYVIYSLLRDNPATPDVYGVCGNMYAVEYAVSAPFLGFTASLLDGRSWEFRADLAVALLDMIEALENTTYGTLYLCDIQESNFGVVRGKDGKLKAKAVDVDIAMFESSLLSQLQFERGEPCSVDDDCFMVSCGSLCHKDTHKCEGVLTSSNLATICSRILTQRHRVHAALLRNPPHDIRDELNTLLQKCSVYGDSHTNKYLLNQLRHVLNQSSGKSSEDSK